MYIKRVYLENIRCFKELTLDLSVEDDVRKWVLILGRNGVGKTTILRSIAMGLCDATSASGLLRELTGDMIRSGQPDPATIHIDFETVCPEESRFTNTKIIKKKWGEKVEQTTDVEQSTDADEFPWERVFACGYGAARRAIGSETYDRYRLIDAVYTLFNYDASLQNPEISFHRLTRAGMKERDLFRRIEEVLMLPGGSISLKKTGITIQGPWGSFVPLGALGDGYAATLAWIADFLGWAMLFQETSFDPDFAGIVLLDEVEHHLHPSWQRRIIKHLRHQFPKIQFIATTHSPLCAAGAADLPDKENSLFSLQQKPEGDVKGELLHPLRGLRADQVLTSEAFGLPTTRNVETEQMLNRLRELDLQEKRTKEEDDEYQKTLSTLESTLPEAAESEYDRKTQRELRQLLDEVKRSLSAEGKENS